ncbi:cobalt transporter CbiM [Clostridium perfringens]|uniref:cobalt transporter CbiM n=1 Tax=Clostridium perfringens TaxID=1502 RepID=UPI002247EDA1|nr:cobalt transporter CbiM [Clostridium perfringens]MCX0361585.1 cobalt transporter CbiM [Clostridium perfringens]MDU7549980.1 cobalt transporter CbiM [Clostridium perfringens]
MHIPENYLSPSTCAVMGIVMIPVWKYSISKVKKEISKKKIPVLGICAAFSFLVMMFNIPAPGGTTAHAVGSVLIAILLGPSAANISVSIVLLIQALFFGDGGILAFGANAFNIAFIMPFSGYYIYKFLKSKIKWKNGEYISAFIGSYLGLNFASFCASIEFGIQPLLFKDDLGHALYSPYSLNVSIPAMVFTHLIIGLIEGAITVSVYAYIKKVVPDLVNDFSKNKSKSNAGFFRKTILLPIIIAIGLTPLGLLASDSAWGEWSTDEIKVLLGYVPNGMTSPSSFHAFADSYTINGTNHIVGYILSAIIGVSTLIIVFKLISNLFVKEN